MPWVIRKHSMHMGMGKTGLSPARNMVDMKKPADMSSTPGPQDPLHGVVHPTEALLKLSMVCRDRIDPATLYNTDSLIVNGIAAAIPIT